MRKRVSWLRWFAGLALVLACVLGSTARGAEPSTDSESSRSLQASERWVPGLSIFGLGMIQGRSGSVDSVERGEHTGSEQAVFASLGFSAELSTPALSWAPAGPRLFTHVDASLSFDTEVAVATEGDPGPLKINSVGNTGVISPLVGSEGQGSATRIATQSPIVSAGLGLSFELPLWDRKLRIKPSVEWEWQKDQLRQLMGAVEANGTNPTACNMPSCRTLFMDRTATQGFHSIGPGLEIEIESARFGETILSVYATGRAYRLLGSRGFEFESLGFWETDGVPNPTEGGPGIDPNFVRSPSTLSSTYERDPWHYSIGVGLRLLWRPE